MEIHDRIYGTFEINEPVLLDLIASPSMERLKVVAQYGIPDEFYHKVNYSRFEHSVGVMLLLRQLGAPLEEQVAGLLHDVSHTAFSHLVDWVLGSEETEDFQDNQHETFLAQSELRDVLERYQYSVSAVADQDRYSLLEQDAPALCADRVDYTLRELGPESKPFLPQLVVCGGKMAFKGEESARAFADAYMNLQRTHWGGFEAVSRYRLFSTLLRHAMKEQMITFEDFWASDEHVLGKLETNDPIIAKGLAILRQPSLLSLERDAQPSMKKFRYVDPHVVREGHLVHLSELDKDFSLMLEKERLHNQQGIYAVYPEKVLS